MDNIELKKTIEDLGNAYEAFKDIHAQEALEIKRLGEADATTKASMAKIQEALDKLGDEKTEIEKRLARLHLDAPQGEGKSEQKAMNDFNLFVESEGSLKNRRIKQVDFEGYQAYKKSFERSLRYGQANIDPEESKAMSVGTDPDGGLWVHPDLGGRIIQKVFETSEMRTIASVQAISTDALKGPNDNNEASAGWVAETAARPATGTPQIGEWRIPVYEVYAKPEATQQMLDDSMVDVEGWLGGKVGDKIGRLENTAFVLGNGTTQPRGFTTYTTAATADATRAWGVMEHVATGTSGGFGAAPNGTDKLIDLVHRLKSAYRSGARFAMTRLTVGEVRKLKATDGSYLWLPSMTADQPATLLGYGVTEMEDMPVIAANSLSIAFGNFSVGYQIVDRHGIRVLRDPFSNKPYVQFYTTKRVGGDVLNFEAIKFMKFI